jgi:hypothetical protein
MRRGNGKGERGRGKEGEALVQGVVMEEEDELSQEEELMRARSVASTSGLDHESIHKFYVCPRKGREEGRGERAKGKGEGEKEGEKKTS